MDFLNALDQNHKVVVDKVTLEFKKINGLVAEFMSVRTQFQTTSTAEISAKMEAIPKINQKPEALFEGTKQFTEDTAANMAESETKLAALHEKTRVFADKQRRGLVPHARPEY